MASNTRGIPSCYVTQPGFCFAVEVFEIVESIAFEKVRENELECVLNFALPLFVAWGQGNGLEAVMLDQSGKQRMKDDVVGIAFEHDLLHPVV
jgi:hypothetical protein